MLDMPINKSIIISIIIIILIPIHVSSIIDDSSHSGNKESHKQTTVRVAQSQQCSKSDIVTGSAYLRRKRKEVIRQGKKLTNVGE